MTAMPALHDEHEYDVVVAGSGAGGMSAAITAAAAGLQVLLIEKTGRIGGSTAISGGALWLPLNAQSQPSGHPDTMDQVQRYMRNVVGDAAAPHMQQAFLDAAAAMLDWFEAHTAVRLAGRSYSPDYYPDRAGAALGGRSMDPVMFDGRLLGAHFCHLRDPLPEFMVLSGMMVTMADAQHLLSVTKSFQSWRAGMKLVLRHAADRLRGYHRGTRLVLGNALAARLFQSLIERRVPYWLNAPLEQIHVAAGSAPGVTGVTVLRAGKPVRVRARRAVVLATGGFPWSEKLRAELYPRPTGPWSMAPQGNSGDGIRLALALGATLGTGHAHPAFWAPVSILQQPDGTELRYPHLVWERAKPGLMAVNRAAQRFVNESASYHEFVLAMYRSHQGVPGIPAYLVCDAPFIERWGLGLALPGGRARARARLVRAGYLHRADTLRGLAQLLGLDPDALERSAERFSGFAASGEDPDFGKGSNAYNRYLGAADQTPNPCLGPLQTGPFYAVKVYPGDIGTAVGLRCNENAQVLGAGDRPITGLYAVGNDLHSVMGGQYPAPGITLGPAMTFGWIAARHIARQPARYETTA
ncbi:FAD-dependent oxidoreductase [Verminephrobacter eiseniae]|uniref:FAD-binding protein n=2 Tax=Verminephrobacter eiseniae TaxID=364317 RepID=UPI00223808D0|nr:FAD-binding protein [Verminephrobacter eiseniae]MCW5229985.1 FAD-dependent oxidoreductase [Verminephrobacter eiseniae]MCW5291717.1 FAD-dependent oxidoreductase [Verminephrobacter eiseniae]MCW8183394.1 FAD-dependent oxidoreductase [Verminephrobacter eiseniae]MCW8221661.1 FAD-dependent oxidoreductase [Verminephrobacter eiseniae]MCW8233489.1 FAD-dependent oxidoreductase [Verminephrobacter eiseniae]